MPLPRIHSAIACALLVLAATTPPAAAADVFTITSSAFADGGRLAVKNAGTSRQNPNCIGDNVSPPLAWSNPPTGTKSYALLMFDPDGRPPMGVSHWVAYGIPNTSSGFFEGQASKPPDGYIGGKNAMGLPHYFGPCPPVGSPHHYIFSLYATDLDAGALRPDLSREEVLEALAGHVIGATSMVGLFSR